MLTRINFLLGLGLLIVIGFYLAGRYAVVVPLMTLIPSWAKPVAGLAVLLGLGLTVQLLAMAMGKWSGVASYDAGQTIGSLSIVSQLAILCGHAGMFYSATGFFTDKFPVSAWQLLIVAALYGTGVVIAIHEWRQRAV